MPLALSLLFDQPPGFFDGFQKKDLLVQAAYGWFRPSSDSVNLTLLILFAASLFFAFISSRLNKSIVVIYSILLSAFVLSYISFISLNPSANGVVASGLLFSLLYGVGKYCTPIIVLIAAGVFVIKKSEIGVTGSGNATGRTGN